MHLTITTVDQDSYSTKEFEKTDETISLLVGEALLNTNNVAKIELKDEYDNVIRTLKSHTDDWEAWYERFG